MKRATFGGWWSKGFCKFGIILVGEKKHEAM